ncbi:sigma-70 family RNA polymerase sigma factor [Kitasatospora sp. NPDC001603]|uniref:sigma-70 family RNA polymerase sigma factor n=1 Tax=Kitasatospora sp. NPDC001603 TaxID=3154388 RepID=UPI0033215ECA
MNEHETAAAARTRAALHLSFTAFCETHGGAWFGLARARLHDDVRALRAVQQMKERLWEQWNTALRAAHPASYAWTLIKSAVADAVAEVIADTGRAPGSPPADRAEAIRYFAAQARISLESLSDHEHLYQAVLRLAERQYDVVVLRYLLGLKDAVIAEHLGITETNVRSTAHQALRKLNRLLDGSDRENKE